MAGANNSDKITWEVLINCVELTKNISQVFHVFQHTTPPTPLRLVRMRKQVSAQGFYLLLSSHLHLHISYSRLRAHVISHLRLGLKDCGKDNQSVGGDEKK